MSILIICVIMFVGGLILFKKPASKNNTLNKVAPPVLVASSVLGFLSLSFVVIDGNKVGLMDRIYTGSDLPAGRIIALDGQKGPQANILGPGFHLKPFVKVFYHVKEAPVLEVPEGSYGLIIAKDGQALPEGQFLASPWKKGSESNMLDASFFLKNGGEKGVQFDVLKPGKYRINLTQFQVKVMKATDVPTGTVAVIRSNIKTAAGECPNSAATKSRGEKGVALPLVPKGCVGVWEEPLPPGRYYLNGKAYVHTIIPTRLQTWVYKGGYTARKINLTVGNDGKITQKETEEVIPVPENAADKAINVRVEGWTIPVEMRVVISVDPANAAKVVASVGSLTKVEDNIVTPAIRDILRTLGGQKGRKVLDFVESRDIIVKDVQESIIIQAMKAGVTVQEVRMGEPAIPPELMVATLREQLAVQLESTYKKEQSAQKERIKVEKERATADQQGELVKAEINKKAAEFTKEKLRLLGEGEKLRLMEIAKGQKAQANVLGKKAALELTALKMTLEAATKNEKIVKVPHVQVGSGSGGAGGSLEGAAAILGASNVVNSIKGISGKAYK